MSEKKFETVSSVVDNFQASDDVFEELLEDSQLSTTWDRYHLIGDVMRGDTAEAINLDLSAKISAALAEEPVVLAPKPRTRVTDTIKAKIVQLAKPFGQVAIAASAAGLMVIGVQQNNIASDVTTPANEVFKPVPFGGIAEPVSLNYQQSTSNNQKQAYIEQQRRFQALLSDHQQQIKLSSVNAESAQSKEDSLPNEKAEESAK